MPTSRPYRSAATSIASRACRAWAGSRTSRGLRLTASLLLIAGLALGQGAPRAAPAERGRAGGRTWSTPGPAGPVRLEEDETRAGVILAASTPGSDGAQPASQLPLPAAFLPLTAEDRPAPGILLPRYRTGLDEADRRVAWRTLEGLPGVAAAGPVLRWGRALLIPKRELLLTLREDSEAALRRVCADEGVRVVAEYPGLSTCFLVETAGTAADSLALSLRLAAHPDILRAEPNFVCRLPRLAAPDDPLYPAQWALSNTGQGGGTIGADVGAPAGWDLETGSSAVVIAVVDEGVDLDHPDLASRIAGGYDATDQPWPEGVEGNAAPGDGHGTACAGIAAAIADNGVGTAGICWDASLLAVRIGYGSYWTEVAWEVDGITWAVDQGADVISNSWGGGPPSPAVLDAIQYARSAGRGGLGCAVLFAAGNDDGAVHYPAAFPEAIAVGASSPCDERKSPISCDGETWWGSSHGAALDLVAPGVAIATTDIAGAAGYAPGDTLLAFNGTSSACPLAAGGVALLLARAPGLTADEIDLYLAVSCADDVGSPGEDTPGWDPYMGWGRLDLAALLALVDAPAAPLDLSCAEIGGTVELDWQLGSVYEEIAVLRDAVEIATLPGDAVAFSDVAPAPGAHDYLVRGRAAGLDGLPAACRQLVLGGATDLVWAPESGDVDGGAALVAALASSGAVPVEVVDLDLVGDLTVFARIWVSLGIFPAKVSLQEADAVRLAEALTAGTGIYLEGGDTWAFDLPTSLHPLFAIEGIDDGTDDLQTVLGLDAGGGVDLSGLDFEYTGENRWIDHLAPLPGAAAIQQNSSPSYTVAITHDSGTGKTIGASFEFGGLADGAATRAELMTAYLELLGGPVLPPVLALTCAVTPAGVDLAWTAQPGHDAVDVLRDGSLIATLAAGSASFLDLAPGPGAHTYAVVGRAGAVAAAPRTCDVTVLPAPVENLQCTELPGGGVDLTWTVPVPGDAISVARDGVLLALLPGGAQSFSDPAASPGAHDYAVALTAAGASAPAATCSVGAALPVIVAEPTGVTACAGEAVQLTVVAAGAGLAYQWRHEGLPVAGATQPVLDLPAVSSADAGSYSVTVTTAGGSVDSVAVALVVQVAPELASAPESAVAEAGTTVTLSAELAPAATGAVSLQWLRDDLPLDGETSPTLVLIGVTAADAGVYRVDATGPCGTLSSAEATVEVITPPPAFVRGDASGDGLVDVSDPVFTLAWLFAGGPSPSCLDAADGDDSGSVDIADALFTLEFIFAFGATPPAPYPAPGIDPSADALSCAGGAP